MSEVDEQVYEGFDHGDVKWWDTAEEPAFHAQIVTIERQHERARSVLTKLVVEHLEKVRDTVPRRLHRADGFHPSELGTRWCSRAAAFRVLLPRAHDNLKFSGALQLAFEMGKAGHKHWQANIYGKMRILKGTWVCTRCLYRMKGFMPDHPCPKCGWQVNPGTGEAVARSSRSKPCMQVCSWPGEGGYENRLRDCAQCERGGSWDFRETRIEIPDWGVVGSFDGIILYLGEEVLLEFKTKRPEDFPLSAPEDDHVIQATIYMWALGMKKALIVYLNKSRGETTEFLIPYDERIIDMVKQRIGLTRDAIAEGVLPNGICGGPKSQEAKVCPYQDACFLGYDQIEEVKRALGLAG